MVGVIAEDVLSSVGQEPEESNAGVDLVVEEMNASTGKVPLNKKLEVEREATGEEDGGEGEDESDDARDKCGEEGGEYDDVEDYALPFNGAIDPLGFAQGGGAYEGVELYQQFERLEYETLAERKRKAFQLQPCDEPARKLQKDEVLGVTREEIEEMMNFGSRRRSRAVKKRGRKKGTKNKLSPEVNIKIGDATLCYASGNYKEAIPLLEEVVRLVPNMPDAYYILGLIYDDMGDRKRALNFHMIAAHLSPKDVSIWKKLISWSIEEKNFGQIRYCLSKAITADPKDVSLRFDRAFLYFEFGEFQKAAESFDQIVGLYPANTEARKMAAKMYQKCGLLEKAIGILEGYVDGFTQDDPSLMHILICLHMENGLYNRAIQLIDKALVSNSNKQLSIFLEAKKAICHVHLGNMEITKVFIQDLLVEHVEENYDLINEVAHTLLTLGHHEYALKLYSMLDRVAPGKENGNLHLKIAQCYVLSNERGKAIPFYYKALAKLEENIDVRLSLASLLVEEGKEDEAISLLSPPKIEDLGTTFDSSSAVPEPWWLSGKVRMQLSKIYRSKEMLEDFVDVIFPSVKKTLTIESINQKLKVRARKRLPKSVLFERAKLLDDQQADNVFRGFKPVAKTSDILKANRAKKSLEKKESMREEKKVAALSAGMDWQCEDSDDEAPPKVIQEPPLPELLKDEEHYQFLLDLLNTLKDLHRYSEMLEIINGLTRLPSDTLSSENKEALQALGAQVAFSASDPKNAYDYARNIVQQHPYSITAWNSYYKVILRFQNRFAKHLKFLHHMRVVNRDCVPPMIINGNHYTMQSMHQAAAEEYLRAYKLQPDNPLINLCELL
ncbi:putative UDP-N-acetylglucosamine--peptide N-acetylglucosaminyltransferase SEC [Apostasia shenzhenica]|uniref:Putative UDP-N-acetylglucosamine--peptide N-acetylglucosaminyltransferase SEC n=1 Tax=Apostasia shenzhenica TaxID=1088818 RepID=A0A2I0ANP6_9ASPA|nr:putative UDP-N-acetylglucosamine--peptide N-acetylglucosaminyltransferase SEC [Apostasia shenzhenica]